MPETHTLSRGPDPRGAKLMACDNAWAAMRTEAAVRYADGARDAGDDKFLLEQLALFTAAILNFSLSVRKRLAVSTVGEPDPAFAKMLTECLIDGLSLTIEASAVLDAAIELQVAA